MMIAWILGVDVVKTMLLTSLLLLVSCIDLGEILTKLVGRLMVTLLLG